MATAAQTAKRRKKHRRHKRCLWCPRRVKKGSLCRHCKVKHRLARRADYAKNRKPGSRQNQCTVCHMLGHNARRHKE